MVKTIIDWLLNIPQYVSEISSFLTEPISKQYFNISPLGLLGIGGGAFLLTLITVHIVRLFV